MLKSAIYKSRHLVERLRRRALLTVGKADASPWVLRGNKLSQKPAYADFVFGLDYLSPTARLVEIFREAMAPLGLSVLLVNNANVEKVTQQVQSGMFRPHTYLDLCARPGSPFENLLSVAANAGIYTVRKPSDNKWVLKAESHQALEKAGLPLPQTVFIPANQPDRELTSEERQRVGERCVVKPSFGEATKGVKLNVTPTKEAIAAARDYDRSQDWLVQQMISWGKLGSRAAYVRGYNVLGHRTLLWWAHERNGYALLGWDELYRYELLPCLDIMNRLAEITQMDFFSTEIAITSGSGMNRYCLIDYVNDACDLDPQGGKNVPPEVWVKWVCDRFAEFTWRRKHGLPATRPDSVYLGPIQSGKVLEQLAGESPTKNAA